MSRSVFACMCVDPPPLIQLAAIIDGQRNRSDRGKLKYDNKSLSAAVTHGSNNSNEHVNTNIDVED